MKKIASLFFLFCLLGCHVLWAQTITLTFMGIDADSNRVQLDSVAVIDVSRGLSEILRGPDSVLTMQISTGIADQSKENVFFLMQNNPNPFNGTTDVNLAVADAGVVTLEITDVNGRIVETQNFASLQTGNNQFRITLSAAGAFVLTARQSGKTSYVKMVNNGGGNGNRIEYTGIADTRHSTFLQPKFITSDLFNIGDWMEYVGYATVNGTRCESQHVSQVLEESQTVVLYFPEQEPQYGQPCPDIPNFTDIDGNVYNTVQVGNQCWMKENLRTTRYADGVVIPQGEDSVWSTTEPYFYILDELASAYGYFYNWPAAVRGIVGSESNPSGLQGVCPTGWHVPSREEWSQLWNYVSSRPQYCCNGNPSNNAKALASSSDWNIDDYMMGWEDCQNPCSVGNCVYANNATGFSALPAGVLMLSEYWETETEFTLAMVPDAQMTAARFWSSTLVNSTRIWFGMDSCLPTVIISVDDESDDELINEEVNSVGYSVRCVKD